jgi:hypothetical protein
MRLPICDGIDPVSGFVSSLSDVMAVRLLISDGIDPVQWRRSDVT